MLDTFVEGQDGSGVGLHDVVLCLVRMKLESNSEEKILLKDGNKINAGRLRESCLDNGDEYYPLGRDRKKDSSLNWEPQLLGSDEKNRELNFSYVASDGILQSEHTVQSAIELSLMLRQSNVSFAEEVLNSGSEYEVLRNQKVELGNEKSVSISEASDLELKLQSDGENVFPFDFGENVVSVHFESSFSKQSSECEQSSDYEIWKAISTDRNRLSIGLSGQEEILQYRREVSCSSSPNFLRWSGDQRSLELEYPELCTMLFTKQKVSWKEKWNNLKLKCLSSRGVWRKRKKMSKNETGGGHPFKNWRRKKG